MSLCGGGQKKYFDITDDADTDNITTPISEPSCSIDEPQM